MRTRNARNAGLVDPLADLRRKRRLAQTRSRAGTRCVAAFSVVSSTNCSGIPCTSPASVAIRAAEISALGDTRS